MDKKELNELYKALYTKAQRIRDLYLSTHYKRKCIMGFYNGHYSKNEEGTYEMEYYPIPVISIIDCCDIEIGLGKISISTKLSKFDAETFDYSLIEKYEFEAYGVENYLEDYYTKGSTINEFVHRVKESNEQHIGFSFIFDDVDEDSVCAFVDLLFNNKFFY